MSTPAEQKIAAIEAVHEANVSAHASAIANLDRARGELERFEAAAAAAAAAFGESEPLSPELAEKSLFADQGLTLARKYFDAAQRKVVTAEDGKAGSARALAEAKREARKEELRRAAAPETLHAAIEPFWKQWHASRNFDALKGVVREYRKTVSSAAEARSLGEHVPSLSPWHAMVPALEAATSEGRAFPGHIGHEHLYESFDAVALVVLFERLVPRPAEHVAGLARFAKALRAGHRTIYDVEAAVAAEDRAARAVVEADAPRPAPKFSPPSVQGRMTTNRGG